MFYQSKLALKPKADLSQMFTVEKGKIEMGKTYRYRFKHTTWWIFFNLESRQWLISTGDSPNEDVWGSYATAEQAADDIFMQATGNDTWDSLQSVPDDIGDIGEWEVH